MVLGFKFFVSGVVSEIAFRQYGSHYLA